MSSLKQVVIITFLSTVERSLFYLQLSKIQRIVGYCKDRYITYLFILVSYLFNPMFIC